MAAARRDLFHRTGETITAGKCSKMPQKPRVARSESALTKETLSNLLQENRQFDPPPELAAHANVTADAYAEADADRIAFWAKAAERLDWDEPWTEVLDWSKPPFAKWFVGGKLNVAVNCVDRHVAAGKGDKVAFHWEGEPGAQ